MGYQNYHSPRSHAWLLDTFNMVARFEKFYENNVGVFLEHRPREYGNIVGNILNKKDDPDDWEESPGLRPVPDRLRQVG